MDGTVVWFCPERGYGFIRSNSDNKDYYAHFKNIKSNDYFRKLINGQMVQFEPVITPKGISAINIVIK